MRASSYRVKVPGAEVLGLAVVSEHTAAITETCTSDDNLGRTVPLLFKSRLSEEGLPPINYLLIGAKVVDSRHQSGISRAVFRTNIQLSDTQEVEDMLPDLVTLPADDQMFGEVQINLVGVECAVDLSSQVVFPVGERIPKKPWLQFVGASFACALEISRNYANIISRQDDLPQTHLGEFVVGRLAA